MPDPRFLHQQKKAQAMRILVVLNPLAGNVSDSNKQEQAIRKAFSKHGYQVDIVLLDKPDLIREFIAKSEHPYDLIVAAGGDGTVSGVADCLVERHIPLGILPLGTGNVVAKSLGISMNLEKAVQTIVTCPYLKYIDTMFVNGKISILNASAGITSRTISEMRREEKRRMGMFAYVWRGVKAVAGLQPHRFRIEVDDHTYIYRAAEVVIVNPDFIGVEPFYWGDDVFIDDGWVDLFVIRGKTFFDLLSLVGSVLWFIKRRSPLLMHIQAKRRIRFDVEQPLPVQIDGDIYGMTPVEIVILPASLQIIVPKP